MDIGKKPLDLIFLDRDGFYFFCEDQNRSFVFDLKPFVSNLEIIDKNGLKTQIKNFIDTNKIASANLVIILSDNILFIKGVAPGQRPDEEEEKAVAFAESIPFEHAQIKSYTIEGGKLLVGTNKNYHQEVSIAFEKSNFFTTLVIPIYSTGIMIDPTIGFNDASAKIILKNLPNLMQFNMEEKENKTKQDEKPHVANTNSEGKEQKPNKNRVFALAGVFVVLIAVLVFVFINSQNSYKAEVAKNKPVNSQIASASPTPAATASPSALLSPQTIKVKLVSPVNSTSVIAIRKSLVDAGYENIITETTQTPPLNPFISYSLNVPTDIKTQIANFVSQTTTNFSTNDEQGPEADVTINLIN